MTDQISRRTFFGATGAGLATAAAASILPASNAAAASEKTGGMKAPAYRFELGELEITTVSDGHRAGEGPYPIFGGDQDQKVVDELLTQNFLPKSQFINGFTPTLVNTGAELILFDTGIGEGGRGAGLGQLRLELEAMGITPEMIDVVVLTHMHPDHVGGLMEGGLPTFPNARYVAGANEYAFWTSPNRVGTAGERVHNIVLEKVKPLAEKMVFIEPGDQIASGIEAVKAYGHTPGHMAYHLESNGNRLLLTADACNHYVVSMQRPDWHVKYDMDKAAAAAVRKELFGMAAADRIPFIGYHMPTPAVGYVEAQDQGFRYVAASYQLDL